MLESEAGGPYLARRWGKLRFEVATRGAARAVVPRGRCCACGGVPGADGGTLHLPHFQPRGTTLPEYDFPLCRECTDMKSLRAIGMYSCAAICFVAVVGVGLHAWFTNPPPKSMRLLLEIVIVAVFAAGLGLALGEFSAWLAGLAEPKARRANRVVEAVAYEFEPYRAGYRLEDYRCFFRFTSEAYARDFAEANAGSLMPPRG